jgi:hypothetical protein
MAVIKYIKDRDKINPPIVLYFRNSFGCKQKLIFLDTIALYNFVKKNIKIEKL